jgi:hypothetical protein
MAPVSAPPNGAMAPPVNQDTPKAPCRRWPASSGRAHRGAETLTSVLTTQPPAALDE